MRNIVKYSTVLVALSLLFCAPARPQPPAQLPQAPAPQAQPPDYPASAEGLQQLLTDVLASAKNHDLVNLTAQIKQMEIPNYEAWFDHAFGTDAGPSWAALYANYLDENEKAFQNLFIQLNVRPGHFVVQEVDDATVLGGGAESNNLNSLTNPVNLYLATWKVSAHSQYPQGAPVGYFVFINGRFRWDNGIIFSNLLRLGISATHSVASTQTFASFAPPSAPTVPNGPAQAGVGSVGWPKCDSCWSPEYSDQARAAKLEGTITLSATIQQDGHATDVAVVKGLGMGLDENAVKAVQKWTFDPARGPDGTPVPVITDIEITFSLNLPNVAASAPGGNNSPVLAGTEGVGFPKCLVCPRPDYSMEARAAKLQGTVLLSATFQADGHVTDIMVVNSLGLGLDEKAIQATQGWRVQPALDSHGTPVSVTTQITVTFHML